MLLHPAFATHTDKPCPVTTLFRSSSRPVERRADSLASIEHDAEPAAFPGQATSDGARLQAARGRRPAWHRVPDRRTPAQGPSGLRQHSRQRVLGAGGVGAAGRSEEHTSELQSLMSNSYAVLCLKTKKKR